MTKGPARLPCAILGAGGYVGQHFSQRLADHPWFDLPLLIGGTTSRGRRLEEMWHLAEPPPPALARTKLVGRGAAALARDGVRVVFSALPSGTAGPIERELARRGVAVFSNAADHRMDPDVPLLVPEVNPAHLELLARRPRGSAPLVTNANCSATGLVVALAPLVRLLRPSVVHVTTFQALSGAGLPGVASLAIADNVVPYIAGEEEKLALETTRILGRVVPGGVRPAPFAVVAQCARVPVRDGHLEAVTLVARARPDRRAINEAWTAFDPLSPLQLPTAPRPPIHVRPEPDRPQPWRDRWAGAPERARGMAVSVGRLRWEPPFLRFFLLSHNAVRGGAGGSVLNAELAHRRGLLDGSGGAPGR
ncbi:MAG: aspartate-semialdehyde dehydrogenase [Thermoplasmata archaeon]